MLGRCGSHLWGQRSHSSGSMTAGRCAKVPAGGGLNGGPVCPAPSVGPRKGGRLSRFECVLCLVSRALQSSLARSLSLSLSRPVHTLSANSVTPWARPRGPLVLVQGLEQEARARSKGWSPAKERGAGPPPKKQGQGLPLSLSPSLPLPSPLSLLPSLSLSVCTLHSL